ncbi:halocyanin [Halobacteriales archaeon QS_1_69_70]|nr:MAG: halocyanin [Halobacteriales archaeon QS_1_69_70]
MKRREFVRAAGGATAAGATAGTAGAAAGAEAEGEGGGEGGKTVPVFGSYLDDANLYSEDGIVDARDQDSVTVDVGAGGDGYAFDPPAVWITPGMTVTWEWTGEGGEHNVIANDGPAGLDSGSPQGSGTYEYEFTEEDAGITTYFCSPHEDLGMKGGVAVGDDVETTTLAGADLKEPIEFGVDIHEHWVGVTVVLTMSVSLVFTFFTLKYGESPHASGGT